MPAVKPPLVINKVDQPKQIDFNYISIIRSYNFLNKSIHPDAQLSVHHCDQFNADPNFLHNETVKGVIKYLKGTAMKDLFSSPILKKI